MLNQNVDNLLRHFNTTYEELAPYAGCTKSNLSKLSNRKDTKPRKHNETVHKFAHALCAFTADKGMSDSLALLLDCKNHDKLEESVYDYLYNNEVPFDIEAEASEFGRRLDKIMTELELTNIKLAEKLGINRLYVGQMRMGKYRPRRRVEQIKEISTILYERAVVGVKVSEIAQIVGVSADRLDPTLLTCYLYGLPILSDSENSKKNKAVFTPVSESVSKEIVFSGSEDVADSNFKVYRGAQGRLDGLIQLFNSALQNNCREVWLYTDMSIYGMSANYRTKYFSALAACMNSGIKLNMICNADLGAADMVFAIENFFDLYLNGSVELYFCADADRCFAHTICVATETACLTSGCVSEANNGEYFYSTDSYSCENAADTIKAIAKNCKPFFTMHYEFNIPSILRSQHRFKRVQLCVAQNMIVINKLNPVQAAFISDEPEVYKVFSRYGETLM